VHTIEAIATDNVGATVYKTVDIKVRWIEQDIFYTDNIDSADGWTFEGEWEFGPPTITDFFFTVPDSGHTGPNCIGYNLDGDYSNNLAVTEWATAPTIDCSGHLGVTLSFRSWLFLTVYDDPVYLQVSGDNGTNWETVLEYKDNIRDTSWTEVLCDISDIADNKSQVKLRWGLGPTDNEYSDYGWHIDDIVLRGSVMNGQFDNDSDGLEDTWELAQYGSLTQLNETVAMEDPDGDGFTTWEEYWSGTNPDDSSSLLKIDKVYMVSDEVCVEWQHVNPSPALPPIAIYSCSNLTSDAWEYAGQKDPLNGVNSWQAAPDQQLFYRLVVTNTP
ncbi:hypothetical protein BVX97_04505, partial [bacterium E08(2017)]